MKKQLAKSLLLAGALSLIGGNAVSAKTISIKSGQTLWKLSQQYGIPVSTLMKKNNLSNTTIVNGQTLKIPVQNTYEVQKGESLWIISQKYNVSVNQLKELNNLSSNVIYPGQTLMLNGTVEADSKTDKIIETAKSQIGVPYKWGGTTPSGFDCSGFINYVFEQHNINIPRTVGDIYNAGQKVLGPEPGNLVFFETYKQGPSHAGIYIGNHKFIHSGSSTGVTISSLETSYWFNRYLGAKSYD